jgi:F420H(2)-dependent quinone reductase
LVALIGRRRDNVSDVNKLPRWLKPMNRLIVALQRKGLALGTMRVLSVPGRKSGRLRTTPISPLVVGGRRYVVGGSAQADWVKNARAAGWGILARGHKEERVRLVELPVEERAPILREFPKEVPGGISFFRSMYELPKEKEALPEAFAALAPRCAVFRLEDEQGVKNMS